MSRAQWEKTRKLPYTEAGIKRMKCIRCGGQAQFQWQICSDKNNYRPLCLQCDIALNCLVLQWFNHPDANALMKRYTITKLKEKNT